MPTFKKNCDFIEILYSIRHTCSVSSVHVQIFWLHELMLITVFMIYKLQEDPAIKVYKNSYELLHTEINTFVSENICNDKAFTVLGRYRNKYAHGAFLYAKDEFATLVNNYKEDLIKMADYVGIELNFERTKLGTYA